MASLQRLFRHRWPGWNPDWFLSETERDNPATVLKPWTDGNAVHPLIHGSEYFSRLVRQLSDTGAGDLILFVGWRMDSEQHLGTGLSVAESQR